MGRSQRHMVRRDGYAADGAKEAEGVVPPGTQYPTTSGISPTTAVHGGSNATITVNGANFTVNSKIVFNNADLVTTFVNSGQMTATAPIAAQGSAGTVQVGARTGQLYSNTQTFTFT